MDGVVAAVCGLASGLIEWAASHAGKTGSVTLGVCPNAVPINGRAYPMVSTAVTMVSTAVTMVSTAVPIDSRAYE
jgi:hypothetical protein